MPREPRTAEVGRLFIIHHPVPPELDDAKLELDRYDRFTSRIGRGSILMITDKIMPPMGSDVRELYREVAAGDPGVEAMATVIGGIAGLGASIMSSIMTQIFQGRMDIAQRTLHSIDDAAAWLLEVAKLEVDAEQIITVASELRAS